MTPGSIVITSLPERGGYQSVKWITNEKANLLGSLCNNGERLPQGFFECPAEGGDVSRRNYRATGQDCDFAKKSRSFLAGRLKSRRSHLPAKPL
jgi:hypothetical protein